MIVQDILDLIDDHGFSDLTVIRKMTAINDAYFDTCSRYSWPFMTKDSAITAASATGILTFPTVPTKVLEVRFLSTLVKQITVDEYYRNFASKGLAAVAKDRPRYWYQTGSGTSTVNFSVWPLPVTNGLALNALYLGDPALLVQAGAESTIMIPKRHHRVILSGALWRLHAMQDDFENAGFFASEVEKKVQDMASDMIVAPLDTPKGEAPLAPVGGK